MRLLCRIWYLYIQQDKGKCMLYTDLILNFHLLLDLKFI